MHRFPPDTHRTAPGISAFENRRPQDCLNLARGHGQLIFAVALFLVSAGLLGPVPAAAQNAIPDAAAVKITPANDLTADAIRLKLKKVEGSKDLDEPTRTAIIDTYNKVLLQLKAGDDAVAREAALQKGVQEAPGQLQQVKSELNSPTPIDAIDATQPLTQMQQSLTQLESRSTELQKKLTDLQAEPKHRADRRVDIPKLQEAARKQLADVESLRSVKPPADEHAEVTDANRSLLDARKRASELELSALDQELKFYEASAELLTARRDLAVVQVAQVDQAVKASRTAVNDRRKSEAEQQARDARKAALHAHPAMKRLAKESTDLTAERQVLAEKIERVSRDSDATEKRLAELDAQFAKIIDRVKRVGLTQAIGLLLRKQRDALPNVELQRSDIEKRQVEISKTSLELVDLEDQRGALADIDAATEKILGEIQDSVNSTELPLIREDVHQMLQTKRGYLDSLIADVNSYLDKLVEHDTRDRQLISKARDYAAFCDEYILWIHSTDIMRPADFLLLVQAVKWLTNPLEWANVANVLRDDALSNRLLYSISTVLLLLLLILQRTWKLWLHATGVEAAKSFTTSFRPTASALVLTALMSISWPSLMLIVGLRLARLSNGSEFVGAVGHSFQILALLLLTLELARHVCTGGGLGEAHFGWPHATLRLIRKNLRLQMAVGLPLAFVVVMVELQSSENAKHSLGRIGFLAGQILLAYSARQVWWATQSLATERSGSDSWLWTKNVRRIWFVTTVGTPLVLGMLAFLGYYFTAVQLEWRLIATFWLMLGLVIVHATLLRGLLMAYRDLAIRRARERQAIQTTVVTPTGSLGSEAAIVPETSFRLSDVNEQTRKLVRIAILATMFAGLCLIWVEVLPALRVLRRIEIWPRTFTILDTVGSTIVPGILTLADVIIAIVIAVVTLAATRNIPGLLEITVLRQLSLDSGVRYAITAVCRYIITIIGIVLTFGQLGIAWSQVQWLVAAISVGLGFGLQEIFANFVSGLILLFERPIRIGDVVSVGDVTGKVTRIRIRATTITDWDLRDLVVPNREFITARVMNWTLTDTLARMTIKIGVAYGSDAERTRQLLLDTANRNPNVLKEPPPHALLDEFGDSTLNFTLRVYLPSLDVFLQTRHELHQAIIEALKKAGIELAFPTREIHIRSTVEPSQPEIFAPHHSLPVVSDAFHNH